MIPFVPLGIGLTCVAGLAMSHVLQLIPAAHHAVFADLRDGIFVLDHLDRVADVNAAAEQITGVDAADLRGRAAGEIVGGQLEPYLRPDIEPRATLTLSASPDAAPRSYEVRVLPIMSATDDHRAPATGRLVILRDITVYQHAQTLLRASFMADVSAALASSLDYEATLQQVARLAVPVLGDWCTVYMLGDDKQVRRVAVAYTDGEKADLALALRRYPPSPVAPRSTVAEVMRTGQAILTPVIPQEYTASIAQDAEHLDIMRRLDFRSSMTVPLQARGDVLGALAFFSSDPDRRYNETDLALADDLARRAGLAVDNARLYREAQQAIRARDEFLSVAAHELKTPLTSMLGFSQMLLRHLTPEGAGDPRIVRRALQAIETQSDRLTRLVSRLLDVARIEGGRLTVEPVNVDIIPLVAGVVDTIQASGSHGHFRTRAPEHLFARVDPLRFEQVLINLLDNAARFSPDGAPVDIDIVETSLGMVRIAVTDRGPGIPQDGRGRIFDRFYQAQTGRSVSGMGLGLYISRQIVEQHDGSISAEFPAEGGTRFVVTLPVGYESRAGTAIPDATT
ncbi:MAG: ATP-binding protein [Chloroflexota bacterium]